MRQVLEKMKVFLKDSYVTLLVENLFTRLQEPELQNCLLKSFRDYPYYHQIRKETVFSAKNAAKQHYKLDDNQLASYIEDKLYETEKEIAREAFECFRMLKAKLMYSKRLNHILKTNDFQEVESYVKQACKKV